MSKKVRFRNNEDGLRVIYDENGNKKELVPKGTILLDPAWGGRFRCLARVDASQPVATTKATDDAPTADNPKEE